MMVSGLWNNFSLPKFIECLESLPNLYTLEIGLVDYDTTSLLGSALSHAELPQIKALILPPTAYPLLGKCRNAEEVVCVFTGADFLFDEFFESLASNPDSKVKCLTIPLLSSINPSSKRYSTPWDYRAGTVADCLSPQNTWPHFRSSPSSPFYTLTQIPP